MTKRLPGPWTDDWEQAMRRIAKLEAAMLRLLEAGAGMATLVSIDWRERKAWDASANAAKTAMGAKITPLK